MKQGKITGLDEGPPAGLSAEGIQKVLSGNQEALTRYNKIRPFLDGVSPEGEGAATPERTIRSWKVKFHDGIQQYGNGFLGLFSKRSAVVIDYQN